MKELNQLLRAVSQTQEACGYSPKLYAASLPVPFQDGEHRMERFFLYSQSVPARERQRPVAWMEWDSRSGHMTRFALCRNQDFVDTSRFPLDCKVDYHISGPGGVREQMERLRRLRELYAVVREAAWKEELTPDEKKAAVEYWNLFQQGAADGLKPFYEGLSGEFFAWLRSVNG